MTDQTRRPIVDLADYDLTQRALHDAIVEGPRKPNAAGMIDAEGRLKGPFAPMLLSAEVGMTLQSLGPLVQSRSVLTPLDREVAILLLSVARSAAVEVSAHSARALSLGIAPNDLKRLVAGELPEGLGNSTRAVATATRVIAGHNQLSDDEFGAVVAIYGRRGVFELIVLLGYYDIIATIFATYEITA